ncbi:hypothetical protein [Flavobacterium sp. NRK1]|uniref:hypothetical protein n=1 Tax=Flavobacterium sp. NRK1 TaxID=2954929 RepID=UPI002092A516|nr:hypothetical protein [Flavobacterium sp. NRK1]MCO6147053.1 hypothetical protein [Flavobacterium sp. NRK1]
MLSKRKSHQQTQKSPIQRFLFVLGIVFFLMYFALGLMIIFWEKIPLSLTRNGRLAMGILLIAYSFFRFIRLWQSTKGNNNEDE